MIASSAISVIFAVLALVGAIRGNDTLTTVSGPFAGLFVSFPALMLWHINGSPAQGRLEQTEAGARRQAQARRAQRGLLWLYTILGPIFAAWYLIRNVFWDAGWLVLAPMGLAGLFWCGLVIFGWRQVKTPSATTTTGRRESHSKLTSTNSRRLRNG